MLNIIDLFAGSGGLSEGFRNPYFNLSFHVEMNSFASQTLKTREVYYYLKKNNRLDTYKDYLTGKITQEQLYSEAPSSIIDKVLNVEITSKSIEDIFKIMDAKFKQQQVHGIIGGPPCQAYSMIGRSSNSNKKHSDKRIYLYQHYVRFLEKYQPQFFIFENVKGLLSFRDEHNELLLPKIIKEFDEVGYSINKQMVNTADFGVPQNRERLFIFGFRKGLPYESFFDHLYRIKESPIVLSELFQDLPAVKPGQTMNHYTDKSSSKYVTTHIRHDDVPLTLNTARMHNKRDLEIYKLVCKAKMDGNQMRYDALPKRLQTHKNTTSFVDRFKALDNNSFSHTIVAHIAKDGHYYIHPDIAQNRSITVREAARIQTFSDNYYFEGSRTAAYQQIGNAVPPLLSQKIAQTILRLNDSVEAVTSE
jgi:DNA (cytosine-5)-methyltransferase 1